MSSLIVNVCKVHKIEKHPNADRLSIVTIDNENGWNCIVGLDQYKPNDLVVYVPPDCVIPPSIIEKYNLEYLKHNGRTSSVKLRGYISQGLILDLPEGKWKQGDDVSSVLGITKYEQPEPNYAPTSTGGKQISKKKLNPLFDRYTDIENIKNFNNVFEEGEMVVVTEKVHGSNGRWSKLPIAYDNRLPLIDKLKYLWKKYIKHDKYEFVYGSHNVQITNHTARNNFYSDDVWGRVAKKYRLAEVIPEDTIVYGEVYGKGIQDLTYGLDDIDMVVFDIKVNGKYIDFQNVVMFCNVRSIPVVPIIDIDMFQTNKLKEWTEGKSKIAPNQMREGCVLKPMEESNNPRIGRKILKSVSAEYLARKGATEFK